MQIKRRKPRPPLAPSAREWVNRGGAGQPRRPHRMPPIEDIIARFPGMPTLPGRGGRDLSPEMLADIPSIKRGGGRKFISPPRSPIRRNPIVPPGMGRPMRPGPSPEMVGEDFDIPEEMAAMPPMRPDRRMPQLPRWEGQLDPSMLPDPGRGIALGQTDDFGPPRSQPQFDLSEDVMNALMEMLMRNRGALGGRAF